MSRARDLADSADLNFDSGTLVIDSANNRVGIGTGSPEAELHLKQSGANKNGIKIERTDNTAEYLLLANHNGGSRIASVDENNVGREAIAFERSSNGSTFSESMRIDASGNLLVGKTAIGQGTAGFEARASGQTFCTDDGNTPFLVNRLTSDGELIQLNKDGTNVGSIGTSTTSSNIYFTGASGEAGIELSGSAWLPMDNGSRSDGGIDLGASSVRHRNLYLSGGVYLGGTGSANYLDDYEEGTWTPTVNGTGGTPSYVIRTGSYVKTGSFVYCEAYINLTVTPSGSTAMSISGLPFTSNSGTSRNRSGSIFPTQGFGGGWDMICLDLGNNSTTISLFKSSATTGNNFADFTAANMGSPFNFRIAISYTV